ncbi:MAG TPA: ABC transporter permease, partial [Phycisphaerales bacterium]|nr:ABC transporter permease [Phycisphaerales bacterium]
MILVRIVIQTFGLAIGQIWANKVRSVLTTLGVIIGVASVVAVIAALQGLRQTVLTEFEKLGAKRVYIDGTLPQSQWHTDRWRDVQLKVEEIEAIREHCPSITSISPEWWGNYAAEYGERKLDAVPTVGIWPTWHDIVGRQVVQGREFIPVDDASRQFVCLINDKAIEELDLPREPVGEFIRVAGRRFKIVGVVETVQLALFGGGDTASELFVPFGTAQVLNPEGWINDAWGSLASPDRVEEARGEITFVLRKMRELAAEDEPTFQIEVLQQFIDQFNALAAGITAGAGGIVGISLL